MEKIIAEVLAKSPQLAACGEALRYTVDRASIKKDTRELSVAMTLNFVMPMEDREEIKRRIIEKLGGLASSVDFTFTYGELLMDRKTTVSLFLPYMAEEVNGRYSAVTKLMAPEKCELAGDSFVVPVLGEFAAEKLNGEVSARFGRLLEDNLGIKGKIKFVNSRELYEEAESEAALWESKELAEEAHERQEKAAAAAENAEAAKNSKGGKYGKNGKYGGRGKNGKAAGNGQPDSVLIGRSIKDSELVSLKTAEENLGTYAAAGKVFKISFRPIKKNSSHLMTLLVTDDSATLCTKAFINNEEQKNNIENSLREGDTVKIKGEVQWDPREDVNNMMLRSLEKSEPKPDREDTCALGKRVELHAHTKMSAMDGLNEPADIVNQAAEWGQPAVAITDHGVVQAFPDAAKAAAALKKKGKDIKVIYGMEGYLLDDTGLAGADGSIDYKSRETYHVILLAATREGLKNIYKLVSLSHLNYFYKRPRLPKSVVEAHREGIIIGSACEAGEIYRAFYNQKPHEEIVRLAKFYDYLEIQPLINNAFLTEDRTEGGKYPDRRRLTEDDLRDINRRIVALGDELGKPVVATTDAHYDRESSAIYRNIIMAGQGYRDAENGRGLYLRTTDEMMEEFSYLGEETAKRVVIDNTNLIADMVEEMTPVPKGKFPPRIPGAEDTLRKACMEKAHSIYGDPLPPEIAQRLDLELNSIINNGYAVMYVSAKMLVEKSLSDGYLVGSRGSVGSSFAATMAGITEVNPLPPHYICPSCKELEWGDLELYDCGVDMEPKKCPKCGTEMNRDGFNIPFATFLGFDGDKEPDIDLNFAGEYQATAHKYVGTIFGEKNVYKAGTVGTIKDKTAYGYVRKFCEEQGIRASKYEIERLTMHCTGVKRTTGQHPGGIVIVPEDHDIHEFCPVQHPANDVKSDIITTHFDYHKIDDNLLKLDILGHNVPSMVRQLQDMTGIDPLTVSLTDRKVLSIFNGIEALDIKDPDYRFTHGSYGIPEFGTNFVRQMLDDTKPQRFADLVRIAGFSHGTDVWKGNAQDYIVSGVAKMNEVISARDDIMNYLILKGIENKTSFQIMEDVRKNRPLSEEQLHIMVEHGVPQWYIDSCIKIKYMFPRAHSVAYTMMSFRMAWYKVYYPAEFYATYFTSVVSDFDEATILQGKEAVLAKIDALKAKGLAITDKEDAELTVLEVAYEMYARGYDFRDMELGLSDASRFRVIDGKVLLPFMAMSGMGETAANALADEYRIKPYETVEELLQRTKLNKSSVENLKQRGVLKGLPESDQLSLF